MSAERAGKQLPLGKIWTNSPPSRPGRRKPRACTLRGPGRHQVKCMGTDPASTYLSEHLNPTAKPKTTYMSHSGRKGGKLVSARSTARAPRAGGAVSPQPGGEALARGLSCSCASAAGGARHTFRGHEVSTHSPFPKGIIQGVTLVLRHELRCGGRAGLRPVPAPH